MKQSIPHDLPPDLAKRAATEAARHYAVEFAKYNPKTEWTSDTTANISFRAKGLSISAKIALLPNLIEVDMEVPMLLRPFKREAVSIVRGTVDDWIRRAKAGAIESA